MSCRPGTGRQNSCRLDGTVAMSAPSTNQETMGARVSAWKGTSCRDAGTRVVVRVPRFHPGVVAS